MTERDDDGRMNFDGDVTIAGGDGTTNTVLSTRDDAVFHPEDIVVDYSAGGSVNSELKLHDTDGGNPDTSDARITFQLAPGDTRTLEGLKMQPIVEDIVAEPDGNQDGAISIFVDGEHDAG